MIRLHLLQLAVICVGLFLPVALHPRTKVVTTEYIYHVPANVAPDQAKEIALSRARAQAIADEFGFLVTQSTSVMIDAHNQDSETDFLSLGGSELKGEWIEDLSDPEFEYLTDGADIAIRVKIKGRIQEITGPKIPIDAKILCNGVTDAHEAERFISGDDLYISFCSPINGYVAIYLIDPSDSAYCLLPYESQTNGIFQTKANHKYLFFHPDHSFGIKPEIVDQVIVYATEQERNRIMIVFSPNKFYKGADTKTDAESPRIMTYDNFKKWLSDLRKKDPDLTLTEKAILINPQR